MSTIRKGSTRRSDDTVEDDSDDKDSKRKSRNLSEKKRRDQFNLLVNELSSMVSSGGRKMDKSTVLKSTISFLKNHNEIAVRSRINEIQEDWKPTFLTNEEFTHLVLEAVDGFIMVFAASGHIYYASENIASLLGHLPSDLLSMTIYDLACEDEQTNLYNLFLSPSMEDKQIEFSCYLRRGGPDAKNPPTYELVNFIGYFRTDEDMVQGDNRYSGYSGEADTRLVFVGTGKIATPQLIKEMPLVDSVKSEFTSRHSLEWKFLFLDHRAPPIIGYLPFELLGTSGYDYYHVDDLSKVVSCHEALMQKGEGTSCYYRFLTKGQQWIWLQTRFYISYHQWNSKPEFIVCTHRVVSYADVMKQSRIDAGDPIETSESSSSMAAASAALPWPSKGKSLVRHGSPSDCSTSISTDSLALRSTKRLRNNPIATQQLSSPLQLQPQLPHLQPQPQLPQLQPQQQLPHLQPQQQLSHLQPQPQLPHLQPQLQLPQLQPQPQLPHLQPLQITAPQQPQQISPSSFLDPPQYFTAIPVQPMIGNYPSPAVLSPLQQVDNMVLSPAQSHQLQADLQRKHAELQAIIEQQQEELRRVSEQLLMARLGLLPGSQPQPMVANVPISYQPSNTGIVSSTTTAIQGYPSGMTGSSSLIVPVSVPMSISLQHQHQATSAMYSAPDCNTQLK